MFLRILDKGWKGGNMNKGFKGKGSLKTSVTV